MTTGSSRGWPDAVEISSAAATLLAAGGTSSVGSTVVRTLLAADVIEVPGLGRDELPQDDTRRGLGDSRGRCNLGEVRDSHRADFIRRAQSRRGRRTPAEAST